MAAPVSESFDEECAMRSRSFREVLFAIAALLAFLTCASPVKAQAPGLVAAYGFAEGAGTTVADSSGNNNMGTISGATWTTAGRFGSALAFNGTSAVVTVPNSTSLQLTTGMTLEAWVYPTVAPTGWRAVIDKNVDRYYLMASSDQGNRPVIGGTWAAGNQNTVGPSVLAVNTWTHLATTFDGATVRLYVNGAQVASQAQTTPLTTSTGTLQIGGDAYTGENFAGRIDEVRIYNRALTLAEIQADMTTPVGGTPPPDTQAPTAPGTLTATAASGTQINLSWGAATDNVGVTGYRVERCQGAGCVNFLENAAPTGTTYSDPGLTANTSYSYRVRATDAAGNLGPYSNVASATTPNTVAGLVAAYGFAEGAGTTVADSSGNNNTGTISGATWTTAGKFGSALVFNGTSSWVSISNSPSLQLTTGMTLEAWVNPFSIPPAGCSPAATCSWMDVIHKDSDRYYIEASSNVNGQPEAGGIFGSGKHIVFAPSALPINTWTHLALTYDSAMIRFYVNGALVASAPETTPITTSTNPLFIGGDQTQGQFFNGLIDEVRVYNRALELAEIQAYMTKPVGGTAPPDAQAPTAPGTLTATAASGTQINLSWGAATDNVGVTGYRVERCQGAGCVNFLENAAPTGTTYSDAGVTANTSYSYRVRATDAAGNLGPYSNVASATTPNTVAGLVAAYGFAEGAGTTVADSSGNNNTGTISGATWTTAGKFGSALVFNGTNSWVSISNSPSLQLTTGMTLEAWVNPFSIPPAGCSPAATCSWMDVIHKDSDRYYIEARSNVNGQPEAGGIFGSGKHIVFAPSALPINTWTHLALTYDSAMIRFYVNAALVASAPETTPITTSTNPLFIGGDQTQGQFFNGLIDEVRVYNRALTLAEIQAYMTKPVGGTAPPDTQAPTAPGTLTATAASGTQINLSWGAATDNVGVTGYRVERCQGAGCVNFLENAAPTGTTYSDAGVTANTSYSYRVRATDAAGNLGPYSNVASATTPNTVAGLVAAYGFAEGAGTTVADSSGNNNTGTISGATWTTAGKFGSALVFNGTNSWVSISNSPSLQLTTGMTLEAWVNPFSIPPAGCSPAATCSWMDVIHKDSDRYYIEARSNVNGQPEAGGIFGSGKHIVFAPSALPINTWTHLALTYDSAMIRFYVNAALVASAP